ncbi:MAG: transposase, partial [Solirubrobacteraceae bacterium]
RIETALADAQYWNEQHMDEVTANQHVQVLIPPDGGASGKQRKGWTGGRYSWMRYLLNCEIGEKLYRKRKHMVEPVFGHSRHNRGVTRFLRRGRTAVRTECLSYVIHEGPGVVKSYVGEFSVCQALDGRGES